MSSYCRIAPGHPVHHAYHASEYGFPQRDESALFERLVLEIMQAGLSWEIVLKRRAGMRDAFAGFEVDRVAAMGEADRSIKTFLFTAMYRHPEVMRVRAKATEIVERLFPLFVDNPGAMPLEWAGLYKGARDDSARARIVADYIAGMTDRYALNEYRRLVDATMDLA